MQQLEELLQTTLKQTFGLPQFRHGQKEAITTLMTQGCLLCILPTGYGKSLLYQLPACLMDGITVVISPLLALMRDQIDHLNRRFNIPAMAINSDQSDEENAAARQAAYEGKIKILFIAPEQLDHIDRFQFLLKLNIKLVVVDEAHCISTWGHDFRPSYRQILNFIHAVHAKSQDIKILGLTATANKHVEADIHKQLFFAGQKGIVLRQAMDRPNIQLSVVHTKGVAMKLAACEQLLERLDGCGLIYCATRENTELVSDYLREAKWNVASYHAGYEIEEKKSCKKNSSKTNIKPSPQQTLWAWESISRICVLSSILTSQDRSQPITKRWDVAEEMDSPLKVSCFSIQQTASSITILSSRHCQQSTISE